MFFTCLLLALGVAAPPAQAALVTTGPATVAISKDFKLPANITSGNAFDTVFTFTFDKESVNGLTTTADKATMPDIANQTITPTATPDVGPTTTGGLTEYGKNLAGFLPVIGDFTHAGEYIYTVSETNAGTTDTNGVKYSQAQYQIHIFVVNNGTSLAFESVTVYQTKTDAGADANTKVDPVPGTTPITLGGMVFNNTYDKAANLTISKTVGGTQGDKT